MFAWVMVAMAGYGDPVAAGVPTPQGRAMHVWTNAARVDPEAFEGDYASGGCSYYTSFSGSEQTPQAPLRHDPGLFEAADVHTLDQFTTGVMSHDSSDGTDFATRVWSYYPGGAIAENVAQSGGDERSMVLSQWMCSGGHRANIMNPIYDDLGAGRYGSFGTLNMGQSGGGDPELRSAAHELSGGDADLYAVVGAPSAPGSVEVVLDGAAVPMAVTWGTANQGVYAASVPNDGGCHEYYVRADFGGAEVRYPEYGSYGWGNCAWDDVDAQWIGRQLSPVAPPGLSTEPWTAGAAVDVSATGVLPGSTVHFVFGTQEGQGPCPNALGGLCIGVTGYVRYLGNATADGSGEAVLTTVVPGPASGRTVLLQAVGDPGAGWMLSPIVYEDVP